MGGDVTEEQAIICAQYLDLVYSHSETMYDLIPQAPHPSIDPTKSPVENSVDGVVCSIQRSLAAKRAKQQITSTTTPSAPTIFAELNVIQSTQTPSNKKNEKGKGKKPGNQQENPKAMAPDNDNKGKRKDKYPCLLCGGDHLMKECPCCEEISKFFEK